MTEAAWTTTVYDRTIKIGPSFGSPKTWAASGANATKIIARPPPNRRISQKLVDQEGVSSNDAERTSDMPMPASVISIAKTTKGVAMPTNP
jgi:hypothetical protein